MSSFVDDSLASARGPRAIVAGFGHITVSPVLHAGPGVPQLMYTDPTVVVHGPSQLGIFEAGHTFVSRDHNRWTQCGTIHVMGRRGYAKLIKARVDDNTYDLLEVAADKYGMSLSGLSRIIFTDWLRRPTIYDMIEEHRSNSTNK